MRILLVEDDAMLGQTLKTALEQQQYSVAWLRDGENALDTLQSERIELVIMDLGLPKRDGISIIREIRSRNIGVPVLILTARDDVQEKVRGLDAGGDDYLLKPFDLHELYARLRALSRRSPQSGGVLRCGDIVMESDAHQVFYKGSPVNLSRREYMLLEIFLNRPTRVFTRQQLEQSIYTWQDDIGSNALEVHIHHLRKKLGSEFIKTVRGVGYTVQGSR